MRTERLLQADRYLPCRKANSQEQSLRHQKYSESSTTVSSHYLQLINPSTERCLAFSKTTRKLSGDYPLTFAKSHPLLTSNSLHPQQKENKKIGKLLAEKIVQVPQIENNFYFSAFDGSNKGILAIGLQHQTYLYNSTTETSYAINQELLSPLEEALVTCIKFNIQQSLLYVAKNSGSVDVYDVNKLKIVRTLHNHLSRVGCMENTEDWGFLSGSKDKTIIHNDIRIQQSATLKVLAHKQEICGLSLRYHTVASGSNDGRVSIWDLRNKETFTERKFHQSAAKALQWCPWKVELLACGSGSKDHQIIFWNNHQQTIEKTLNGKSQVTGLRWRQSSRDLVTVHGGRSGYGLLWDYEESRYKAVLSGHSGRILGLVLEGDCGLWTIGSDQTLRFWRTGKACSSAQLNKPNMLQMFIK